MKNIRLSDFIEEADSLTEKCFIWQLNIYTSAGQFDQVLKAKWALLEYYQKGE